MEGFCKYINSKRKIREDCCSVGQEPACQKTWERLKFVILSLRQSGAKNTALVEDDPFREHFSNLDMQKFMVCDRNCPQC